MVTIKGTGEQIAAALLQIKDKIREEKEARIKLEVSSASRLPRGKLSARSTASTTSEQAQTTESLSLQGTLHINNVLIFIIYGYFIRIICLFC